MTEKDFGSRLKALRQGRKMTQAQAAALSYVTLRAFAYWEAGAHLPGNQELEGVARALQLTLEERQALTALLPTNRVGKIVRDAPAWIDIVAPPAWAT